MSDSTAFLGGAAAAGLAAMLMVRGGFGATSAPPTMATPQTAPTVTSYNPVPAPVLPTLPIAAPPMANLYNPVPQNNQNTNDEVQQKVAVEQMKTLLEQQKAETEKLRSQLQGQQSVIENLTAQARAAAANATNQPVRPMAPNANSQALLSQQQSWQPENPMFTGMLWALGGVALSLGGGIALVGMFILFAKQHNRTPRSVEIIQPMDYPYAPNHYIHPLPPRRVAVKRVKTIDD